MEPPSKKLKLKASLLPEKLKRKQGSSLSRSSEPTSSSVLPKDTEILEKDLPLLSNVDEVSVEHYLLKFAFDFASRTVAGSLILFLNPVDPADANTKTTSCPSRIILDCCGIQVFKVSVLKWSEEQCLTDTHAQARTDDTDWFGMAMQESGITFHLDKWSLTISNWSSFDINKFPRVLRIDYETLPETPSLHWRPTRSLNYTENSACVYTPASPVNNRGLFPCQEHPSAMATWECFVTVPKPYSPLLSSDEPGKYVRDSCWYFRTRHLMPLSTFAIVVGFFPIQIEKLVEVPPEECDQGQLIPVRLYSLSFISLPNVSELSKYIKNTLVSAHDLLGPHPFPRLDIVIMNPSYPKLGLASPHMIFVSRSIFTGNNNEPLYFSCLPHEICHSWFGLSIGALELNNF
jgi:aminopeptidase O